MKRVIWCILDSVGIGGAPDAAAFGDEGSDTLGHIAEWFMKEKGRSLALPNLDRLGLGAAYELVHGCRPDGWEAVEAEGCFAAATEISTGKDTPSGHWELAGVPASWEWGYFPKVERCFPEELIAEIERRAGLEGSLGHCHASGTEVIARLGAESVRSGKPIFYTSADSVFQIAAHEEAFGLERLYELCELVRELTLEMNVGRVIARPFVGDEGAYERTGNRKDYAVTPPKATVLEVAKDGGRKVCGVGKIGDIFAHVGLSEELKASGHERLWERTREALAGSGELVMTNFVDFDMLYGHRRDPEGYGLALEEWDAELGRFLAELGEEDLVVITADHGNDPTWEGTDHTRERVPVVIYGGGKRNGGVRESFCDVGATVAKWLGLEVDEGESIL
ncbi:MAG: phosphopentomutase [Verrucomicrobiaceae bacterium]